MAKSKGVASLFRDMGRRSKEQASQTASDTGGATAKIYSILDYIESPWGLDMKLFPAQKFLVKLYYNLELDSKLPEEDHRRIQITDPFREKLKYELSEKDY